MRNGFKVLGLAVVTLLVLQCSKEKPTQTKIPFGRSVSFSPVDWMANPAGGIYEGWVVTLDIVGLGVYTPQYFSLGRFGWDNYVFTFLDSAGNARGGDFTANQNLFTEDFAPIVHPETLKVIARRMAEGNTVQLSFANRALAGLKVLLVSVEPLIDTARSTPDIPFLAGVCNISGKFDLIYPINYKDPDVECHYFLASPSDTLINLGKDSSTVAKNNETEGIWVGIFDPKSSARGMPDTIFANLDVVKGWQFETWFQKGSTLISLGKIRRADSADLSNPYTDTLRKAFQIPGEDFRINNPPFTNALAATIMLTLEPYPDPDPASIFPLLLFRDTTRDSIASLNPLTQKFEDNVHHNFLFDNRARFFPKIKATVIPEQ